VTVRTSATGVERDSRPFLALSMRAMEGEQPLRLSALRALLALDRSAVTVGNLGNSLNLSQSATSRLVDRLLHLGLVERSADDRDRRQVTVRATTEGRAVIARLAARRRRAVRDVLARMDEQDRAALERGLAAFAAAARDR
jgi:DNA-binding MarR family transcriptional regulator